MSFRHAVNRRHLVRGDLDISRLVVYMGGADRLANIDPLQKAVEIFTFLLGVPMLDEMELHVPGPIFEAP